MAKSEAKANKEKKLKKSFIKEFKAELKKVNWPTPKQLVNNTVAVITIVLILTAIVFVLDVAFDAMSKYGISNLQSYVVEQFSKDSENEKESNVDNSSNSNETQETSTGNETTQSSQEQNTTKVSE